MKESPINFSTEMVRAILEDRKTQTRRIIKPPNKYALPYRWTIVKPHSGGGWMATDGIPEKIKELDKTGFKCPYGEVGDRLWVRETYMINTMGICVYKAAWWDGAFPKEIKWQPSIFMPRKYSRIILEITGIRCERVQEITEEDAKKEGVLPDKETGGYVDSFMCLWDSLNAKRGYGWDKNPYVWCVAFRRIK
jgi:hypothetical protein